MRTTDGGNKWEISFVDTAFENPHFEFPYEILRAMQYPNNKLCIFVGDSGLVLRSTDNGASWEKTKHDSLLFWQIFMKNENDGFVIANRKDSFLLEGKLGVWKTSDGGQTFVRNPIAIIPFSVALNNSYIQKVDDDLIIVTSDFFDTNGKWVNKFIKFRSNWTVWDTLSRPEGGFYKYFVDSLNGWVADANKIKDSAGFQTWKQYIYHTSDGGKNWEKQWDTILNGDRIYSITMYDKNFGFVGSGDGDYIYTRDGGKNWIALKINKQKPPYLDIINKIRIFNNDESLFFVNNMYLLKYKRLPSLVESSLSSGFLLYPNPASDYIEISGADGEVKVYDLLGIEFTTPALRATPPWQGGEKVRMDVSALAPGVYFVRVGDMMHKFLKL